LVCHYLRLAAIVGCVLEVKEFAHRLCRLVALPLDLLDEVSGLPAVLVAGAAAERSAVGCRVGGEW
jgi:hypothetical protein